MQKDTHGLSKAALLRSLFFSMLYISTFTFGGGFVIITFMKRKFVDELHWIDEDEILDLTALAQSSPGAIAVNAAILVGWRVAGFAGMLVAIVGTILPPMTILYIISFFYAAFASNLYVAMVLKGMQAGVAAVILDVVFSLGGKVVKEKSILNLAIMALAFCAVFFFNVNVIYIILAAALTGLVRALVLQRRKKL
jgi:chromate transporter